MPLWTMGLLSVNPPKPPTSRVFLRRNRFKMVRIHTGPITAEMIQLQALGYEPRQELIRPPMGLNCLTTYCEPAIPILGMSKGIPIPAEPSGNYLLSESFICRET